MADWRERGYVPDSDEEYDDDDLSLLSQSRPLGNDDEQQPTGVSVVGTGPGDALVKDFHVHDRSNNDGGCSVPREVPTPGDHSAIATIADRLEAEIQKGLEATQQALRIHTPPPISENGNSAVSSPLSSLPSSPLGSPIRHEIVRLDHGVVSSQAQQDLSRPDSSPSAPPLNQGRRMILRQRHAGQLHPYQIDRVRYETLWRERGLSPVRERREPRDHLVSGILRVLDDSENGQSAAPSSEAPQDSQDRGTVEDENESQSPVNGLRSTTALPDWNSDDELPDLQDILRSTASKTVRPRKHRAKLGVIKLMDTDGEKHPENEADRMELDLLPSPPRSSDLKSPAFTEDVPMHATPSVLITPRHSSEKPTTKRVSSVVDLSSDEETEGEGDVRSSAASESAHSDEESQGILLARKKIRGVLPASFLTLDSLYAKKTAEKRRIILSPGKAAAERGVAKRISSSAVPPKYSGSRLRLDMSSGGETEDSSTEDQPNRDRPLSRGESYDLDDRDNTIMDFEVAEENEVDFMEPPSAPRRSSGKTAPKRQRRLDDGWIGGFQAGNHVKGHDSHRPGPGPASRSRRLRQEGRKRKRVKRNPPPLQFSILDAPGVTLEKRSKQPAFLKVAARPKTNMKGTGLQNPATKFLRLATKEDTADANEELDNWRAGRNTTQRKQGEPHRETRRLASNLNPLATQPRPQSGRASAQLLSTQSISHSLIDKLKRKTDSTLKLLDLRASAHANNEIPTHTLPTDSLTTAQRTPGLLSSYRNRSGKGALETNIRSRAAQLEGPETSASLSPFLVNRLIPKSTTSSHRIRPPGDAADGEGTANDLKYPKRKPQSSRKRKARPMQSIQQELPIREGRAGKEIPVEQIPSMGGQPGENDTDYLIELASILANGVEFKFMVEELSNFPSLFSDATFVGRGLLSQTIKAMAGTISTIELPEAPATELLSPKTQQKLKCTALSTKTADFVNDILSEIAELIFHSSSQEPGLQDMLAESPSTIYGHLDQVIIAVNRVAGFRKPESCTDFISVALQGAEAFFEQVKRWQSAGIESDELFPLHVLNRVVVYSYQLSKLATQEGDPNTIEKANTVFFQLADIAMFLSLKPSAIVQVLTPVLKLLWELPTLDILDICLFNEEKPGIETVVIWHSLMKADSHQLQAKLAVLLSRLIQEFSGPTSAHRLAYTMCLFRVICPILHLAHDGQYVLDLPINERGSSWELLVPVLEAFLVDYTKPGGNNQELGQRLGLAAFQLCLSLLAFWEWHEPENLLKLLFKTYIDQNMVELFVPPPSKDSSFLERDKNAASRMDEADTDFELFLKLTAVTLQQKSEVRDEAAGTSHANTITSRIKSLVFSLAPNNSRSLFEDKTLKKVDLVAMANIYKLYQVLYRFAPPDCRPRLGQVEDLIDFGSCHEKVCDLAVLSWYGTVYHAIDTGSDMSELHEFSLWIARMAMQRVKKFTSFLAATKAEKTQNVETQSSVERIIVTNRHNISIQVAEILSTWAKAVKFCPNKTGARTLLMGDDLETISHLLRDDFGLEEIVLINSLELVRAYVEKPAYNIRDNSFPLLERIQEMVQKGLTETLARSTEKSASSSVLQTLTTTWFYIARAWVHARSMTWDDYLTAPAPRSFEMLANTENSRQCKVLFTSLLIMEDPIYFELDRIYFYTAWIESLLQPDAALKFENILTRQIILSDPETLSLRKLQNQFGSGDELVSLTTDGVIQARFEIIKHLVSHIYNLPYESQNESQEMLDSGLDVVQGRMLLQVITATMKKTWRGVTDDVRTQWTSFIEAVLTELRIYKYPGFVIDAWFTDPEQTEFPKKGQNLAELLLYTPGRPKRSIDLPFAVMVRKINVQCVVLKQQDIFCISLVEGLACYESNLVDDAGNLLVDVLLQMQLMKLVLPAYVEQTIVLGPFTMLAIPVLAALERTYRDFAQRIDIDRAEKIREWIPVSVTLLASVRKALVRGGTFFPQEFRNETMGPSHLIRLTVAILSQWANVVSCLGPSEPEPAVKEYVRDLACSIYRAVSEPLGNHGFIEKLNLVLSPDEVELKNAVLKDLEDSVEADWRVANGTWAGQKFYVVRYGGSGLVDTNPPEDFDISADFSRAMRDFERMLRQMGLLDIADDGATVGEQEEGADDEGSGSGSGSGPGHWMRQFARAREHQR